MGGRRHLLLLLMLLAAAVARGQGPQAPKHEKQIAARDQEIQALKAQLRDKEAEISKSRQWKDEIGVKDESISALEAQIVALKNQVGRTQTATEGHLSACQQKLDTAKRSSAKAEKQLQELEQQNESLSSELSKVQTKLSKIQSSEAEGQSQLQSCKGELKGLASRVQAAENEANAAKAEVLKLQKELESAAVPAWLREAMSNTMAWVAPYTDMATSHPLVGNLTSGAMKCSNMAAKSLSEAYAAAKPTMDEFTVMAKEWMTSSYVAAKPHIDVAVETVQKYTSEVMASEAVANIKLQSSATAAELKQYIGSQMAAVPALQPYATPETLDVVLYTLVSLPGLVLLSFLPGCCCRSAKKSRAKEQSTGGAAKGGAGKGDAGKGGAGKGGAGKGGAGKDGIDKSAQSAAKGPKKSKKQKS